MDGIAKTVSLPLRWTNFVEVVQEMQRCWAKCIDIWSMSKSVKHEAFPRC